MFDDGTVVIGCNLKQLRKARKVSQEKLAEKLQIARKTLVFYEAGRAYPKVDVAFTIAKILDVEISQIWYVDGAAPELPAVGI